jgi:putative heme-binding domain-containing protein
MRLAPDESAVDQLVSGFQRALDGRTLAHGTTELLTTINGIWQRQPQNLMRWQLAMRVGNQQAIAQALQRIADKTAPLAERRTLIACLGQVHPAGIVDKLVSLIEPKEPVEVEQASLSALQGYSDPVIADTLLSRYAVLSGPMRSRTQQYLASREHSARQLLDRVNAGSISAKEIPVDVVRRLAQFNDAAIKSLIFKHWGRIEPLTLGEKTARINSVKHMLGSGKGDSSKGKAHFTKLCATCHTLFAEGNKVGPELTGADRRDVDFLTTSIVDPSAVVRQEFVAQVANLNDGRFLTGLVAEAGPATVTLLDAKNERTIIPRKNIESLEPARQSLMPEKILDELDDQQIRDLFAYLQSTGPTSPSKQSVKPVQADDKPKKIKVCLISGSLEYDSDISLALLQEYLEKNYPIKCTRAFRKTDTDIPGLEALDTCDAAVFFTRRLTPNAKQLELIKKYCESGKPIVGIRTASHGFQNWLEMDKEVLGGNYKGHYGTDPTSVAFVPGSESHPILNGVKKFDSPGSLYRNTGLAKDARVLLNGTIPGHTEPIAWTRLHRGGRVFYTSLGHQDDFKNSQFLTLLANALYWTMQKQPPAPPRQDASALPLHRQALERLPDGRVEWKPIEDRVPVQWDHTAVIICDMWDKHWSKGATGRVDKLAPQVNKFIQRARAAGAIIIHAPSETMPFYAGTAARKRVLSAKNVPMPTPQKHEDPPQPVDSSDGGSDTGEPNWFKAWSRQHPAIKIDQDRDFITDDGQQVWNVLQERGIRQVLIVGVHTNMCVLNRSFAIKSLVTRGMPVALVRDLTDAMYNPARSPYVSHQEGTRLIIDYIEKFWCPTLTSQEVAAAIKAKQ